MLSGHRRFLKRCKTVKHLKKKQNWDCQALLYSWGPHNCQWSNSVWKLLRIPLEKLGTQDGNRKLKKVHPVFQNTLPAQHPFPAIISWGKFPRQFLTLTGRWSSNPAQGWGWAAGTWPWWGQEAHVRQRHCSTSWDLHPGLDTLLNLCWDVLLCLLWFYKWRSLPCIIPSNQNKSC